MDFFTDMQQTDFAFHIMQTRGEQSVKNPRAAFRALSPNRAISDGCDVIIYDTMVKWIKVLKSLRNQHPDFVTIVVRIFCFPVHMSHTKFVIDKLNICSCLRYSDTRSAEVLFSLLCLCRTPAYTLSPNIVKDSQHIEF